MLSTKDNTTFDNRTKTLPERESERESWSWIASKKERIEPSFLSLGSYWKAAFYFPLQAYFLSKPTIVVAYKSKAHMNTNVCTTSVYSCIKKEEKMNQNVPFYDFSKGSHQIVNIFLTFWTIIGTLCFGLRHDLGLSLSQFGPFCRPVNLIWTLIPPQNDKNSICLFQLVHIFEEGKK